MIKIIDLDNRYTYQTYTEDDKVLGICRFNRKSRIPSFFQTYIISVKKDVKRSFSIGCSEACATSLFNNKTFQSHERLKMSKTEKENNPVIIILGKGATVNITVNINSNNKEKVNKEKDEKMFPFQTLVFYIAGVVGIVAGAISILQQFKILQ